MAPSAFGISEAQGPPFLMGDLMRERCFPDQDGQWPEEKARWTGWRQEGPGVSMKKAAGVSAPSCATPGISNPPTEVCEPAQTSSSSSKAGLRVGRIGVTGRTRAFELVILRFKSQLHH